MREMGTVELFTREGEIIIAKRIEEGIRELMAALASLPGSGAPALQRIRPGRQGRTQADRRHDRLPRLPPNMCPRPPKWPQPPSKKQPNEKATPLKRKRGSCRPRPRRGQEAFRGAEAQCTKTKSHSLLKGRDHIRCAHRDEQARRVIQVLSSSRRGCLTR